MSEVRVTDPNTGGMKNQKLEQYSLVDPGFRGFMVDSWTGGARQDAADGMLQFEQGDDTCIYGVVYACQDLLMDCYSPGDRGAVARHFAVQELAKQYGFGSRKYDRGNWRKGYAWSLSIDAFWRHLIVAFTVDDESGNHHAAAALWHACCLRDFMEKNLGTDDRLYKKGPEPLLLEPGEIQPVYAETGLSTVKADMDRALVSLFSIPSITSEYAPESRLFFVDDNVECEVVLSDLETCDGCPDREACVAEAEAGL